MTIQPSDYSAIIFDLGGVLLNLDYQKTIKAFDKLGVSSAQSIYSQVNQAQLFDDLETGKINPTYFRAHFKKVFELNCTDAQLDSAWNAMLLDLPQSRIKLLQQVSKQTRMFLFSNTNKIHIDWFNNYLLQIGESTFWEMFEAAYLSHEVQLRKPHTETFNWLVSQKELDPKSTLFIDDSEQHILGAKKAGLQTYWLQPEEEITDLFGDFLA